MAEVDQSPLNLDVGDPYFPDEVHEWSLQMIFEMRQTIIATNETIAVSRAFIAEADRILKRQ